MSGNLRCGIGIAVIWLAIPAIAASCYYLLAILAAALWRRSMTWQDSGEWTPPLSVLKPVHGRDPSFYDAILSHANQDYPEFELLFGLVNPNDPAIADIRRLQREFPHLRIEIAIVETDAPNAKVGVLAELARRARHSMLLVNDSDIVVEPGYFRTVTAPLHNPQIGMVTCLYRAKSCSWPSHSEANAAMRGSAAFSTATPSGSTTSTWVRTTRTSWSLSWMSNSARLSAPPRSVTMPTWQRS